MIGGFDVYIDGDLITSDEWPPRRSAELVQLLALCDDHRMARDQVMEALWPHLDADAAAANLRKAAHHARRALRASDALLLRRGMVTLFPDGEITTDFEELMRLSRETIDGEPSEASRVFNRFKGELLPDAVYEEWTQPARSQLHAVRVDLARAGRLWDELIALEPLDETGYLEIMREAIDAGDRARAIKWYGTLRSVLAAELSLTPSREVEELYRSCVDGLGSARSQLIGQQLALATATGALEQTHHTRIRCLAISGEGGMGKTRLTREFESLAREHDWLAFRTTCLESGRPYQPLISVIHQILDVPEDAVAAEIRESLSPLVVTTDEPGRDVGRHKVVEILERALLAIGQVDILVVFDDFHRADEATIDVLFRWLAVDSPPVVLIALGFDPASAPESLLDGVARLGRSGRSIDIALESLTPDQVAQLVNGAAVTKPTRAAMHQIVGLAEGNPGRAQELARSLDDEGELEVSPSIWKAALSWAADIDDGSVAMLRRLAVTTGDLSTDEVIAVTGLDEESAFALLDTALDLDIMEVANGRYRFGKELVRKALTQSLPPHRRLAIHRDVARHLGAHDTSNPQRVAHHWLEGERPGEAARWLLASARRANDIGAFADCVRHADRLLEHDPSHSEALVLRADSMAALGRPDAIAAYAEAASRLPEQEAHEVRARMALTQIKSGDPVGALETLASIRPSTINGQIWEALTLSGAAAIGFADPELAVEKATEARGLALESGNTSAVVEATWALSLAAHSQSSLGTRIEADLSLTAHLEHLAIGVFDGHLCAAERLLYGSQPYDEVIAFAQSLGEEAERKGAIRGQGFALTLSGEAKMLSGRLDEAGEDLDRSVQLNRRVGASAGEALALQRRAETYIQQGKPEKAGPLLSQALSVARRSYLAHHLLDRIYGSMIRQEDDNSRALALVEEAEQAVLGPFETCPACRITLEVPAAIAAAHAGDLDRANRHANVVQMLSTMIVPQPGWKAANEEIRGHLAAATHDMTEAQSRFLQAAVLYRGAGQPLDAARCDQMAALR
jgi:DNA-binding SARP family transcriptional activator